MASMEIDVNGFELGFTDIYNDYEKLEVRLNVESDYASMGAKNDNVYENIEVSPDLLHEEEEDKSGRKCSNRQRIGLILLLFTVVSTIVTVTVIVTRGNEGDLEKDESSVRNKNEENVTVTASTTQEISWTTPSQHSNRQQVTTSPALESSTTLTKGSWLQWSRWTACSSTCEDGTHVRYRSCSELFNCDGNHKEIQQCFASICPVYGSWSIWSSWTRCDVTCGKGLQIRTRKCSKVNTSDIDCVGKNTKEQLCSFGVCPDCSMTCTSGVLNTECNMCNCNQTLSGLVSSAYHSHYAPLRDVYIHVSHVALTTTDELGQFNISNVCLNTVVIFSKTGFIDRFVKLGSTRTNITLTKAELPHITVEPQTKARMVGENVTLCCSAQGAPNIRYYEWFKDSNILDETFQQDSSSIFLTNISKFDKGKYSCRANNKYGSIRSKEVYLDVQDSTVGFCENALEQKKIRLPPECYLNNMNYSVLEVGHCNPKLCRMNYKPYESSTCRNGFQNCCLASDFRIFDIQCKAYKLPVFKVISCECGLCHNSSIKIEGTALTYPKTEIAKFYEVYLNGIFKTYTSTKGTFSISVDTNRHRIVLNVLKGLGHSTTKVIDLSETSTGTIYTTVYVVDVSISVQIDPSRAQIISIDKISGKQDSSFAELHIPQQSFANSLLQIQLELVNISVSYLDSKNVTDLDVMPGLLTSVNDRGDFETIKSFGSFHVTVYDAKTKEVLSIVKNISIVISENMKQWDNEMFLYEINTVSGLYELMPNSNSILPMSSWLIIGRPLSENSKCFFSVQVFEHSSLLTEVADSRYQFYLQTVHIGNGSFKTYSHTVSPSSTCFRTICDNTKGYIEMWVSNSETQSEEFLLPANPNSTDDIGLHQQRQSLMQYSVTNDSNHLGIIFTNSIDGPFFSSEAACLASNTNHFKFYFRGFVEDVFTFRQFFDVQSDNIEEMRQISQRVWYQRRVEGYRICFVKVKIVMQNGNNKKVRAASFGGTNVNISDVLLGIREAIALKTTTICMEYKCSGTIDEHTSSGEYDFTRVNITTEQCLVQSFSKTLIDNFSETKTNNTDSDNFLFYAPASYSPKLGIYSATTASGNIESAKAVSRGECRSGKAFDYSTDNPDIGVAVTFFCP